MSDLAYSLLPQERDGDMVWGCHKDTLSHRVAAISDATKGERFTAHDLRRTAATHWTALGGGDVRERLLNHVTPGLEGTYNLYGFEDEKRNTMALWGEFILSSIE
ncbi:MAG: hypothetical protein GY813_06220 [Halieaceae bacterium]|nr:hypothetical protein [Halieaceae bacterium]